MKSILVIGLVIYFLSRLVLCYWQRKEKSKKQKKESLILFLAELITVMVIFFQLLFDPLKAELFSGFIGLGYFFFIMGIFLSVLGRFSLGENWRTAREFSRPIRLVQTSIYRYLRHPIYLGSWLMGLGFELVLGSWLFLVVLFLGFPFILICAKKEERLMLIWFGKEYRDYMEKTSKFFPYIF